MCGPERATGPEATERAGATLAASLHPGDVVLVSGEVGAGKTTFVRGALRALGVTEPVTSPTFVIGQLYEGGAGPLAHLDLYRLEGGEDEDPGLLDPYFGPEVVSFVEWPERVGRSRSWPGARSPATSRSRTRGATSAPCASNEPGRAGPRLRHRHGGHGGGAPAPRRPGVRGPRRSGPRRAPGSREPAAGARRAGPGRGRRELGGGGAARRGDRPRGLHRAADRRRHRSRARAGARAARGGRGLAARAGGGRPGRRSGRRRPPGRGVRGGVA
jgi:tRNA threonylcarbamoyladenosine biosynthesis protein TsaE